MRPVPLALALLLTPALAGCPPRELPPPTPVETYTVYEPLWPGSITLRPVHPAAPGGLLTDFVYRVRLSPDAPSPDTHFVLRITHSVSASPSSADYDIYADPAGHWLPHGLATHYRQPPRPCAYDPTALANLHAWYTTHSTTRP